MSAAPKEWMSRNRWDALVRGEDCPLCAECQSNEPVSPEGFTVERLHISQLRLMRNQYIAGYAVLICTKHVREPYHLDPNEQTLFFSDLTRAARALDHVFAPTKMNYQMLGNLVPHLHAHLVPRYFGDPAPGRPIDPGAQLITLSEEDYADRVRRIQTAL